MVTPKKREDFLKLIRSRKSVHEFSSRKVKDSDIKKILEAARWAPSAHNSQDWHFIVVKDAGVINSLMRHCYYGSFYESPPMIIAIVAKPVYNDKKGLLQGNIREYAPTHKYMNVGSVVITVVYAASSLGIGSCILSLRPADANKILKVPKKDETLLLVGLGYEKKGAFAQKRERKELKDIVSYGSYRGKQ